MICCESIPRQVNFLIDEAVDAGKGSNTICSMIHYFFEHHGLGLKQYFTLHNDTLTTHKFSGETDVHLHADNCCGQNKNQYVIHVSYSYY